jgi:Flp pilus assembly protein TadG
MVSFRPTGERGSTTLWILGLTLTLFMVGGISVDLWRTLAEHRDLAGIADAAATAAASGVDTEYFRATGLVRLDPASAGDLALAQIAAQPTGANLSVPADVVVSGDGLTVAVTLHRTVRLTLLALLAPGEDITVGAEAIADVTLRP